MNTPFSWHSPIGRTPYLLQSIAPALMFAVALIAMQLSLASTLPPYLGPLFALIAYVILLVAASSNPLVVPLGGSTLALLVSGFPNLLLPKLSIATGISLALLCFAIMVACLLRLIALTLRRCRDAGTQASSAFALSASLYVGGVVLAFGLRGHDEAVAIYILCALLPVALQCWLLLKPTCK